MAAPVEQDQHPDVLAHNGPWTLDEWLALPETPNRVELVDGTLVVMPISAVRNGRLMLRLSSQLTDAAPPEFEVLPEVNAALGGDRALIPDFCVIDAPGFEGVLVPAAHLVLVAEIASPSTRVYDRTVKRSLYAEAAVPYLLLVEPGAPTRQPPAPSAVCYELRDGEYREAARSAAGVLELQRPFPVTLRLA